MKRSFPIIHPNGRNKIGDVIEKEPGIGTFEIVRDSTQRFNKKPEYVNDEGISLSRVSFKQINQLEFDHGVKTKYLECYCPDLKATFKITLQKFLENKKTEDYSSSPNKRNCDSQQSCCRLSFFTKIPKGQKVLSS